MLIKTLQELIARDLAKLKTEISLYTDETKLWVVQGAIPNSAGNLCLHLVGNLNTYIGAGLGNSGYTRHRDLEFSLKGVPKGELLQKIDETAAVVAATLASLTDEQLASEYPLPVFEGKKMTTAHFLMHLAMHLSYHLGQVNYHRRLLHG